MNSWCKKCGVDVYVDGKCCAFGCGHVKDAAPAAPMEGARVIVGGQLATFRGINPKIPGDYWIEFDYGGGWWSYHPSDVQPVHPTSAATRRTVT